MSYHIAGQDLTSMLFYASSSFIIAVIVSPTGLELGYFRSYTIDRERMRMISHSHARQCPCLLLSWSWPLCSRVGSPCQIEAAGHAYFERTCLGCCVAVSPAFRKAYARADIATTQICRSNFNPYHLFLCTSQSLLLTVVELGRPPHKSVLS